MRLSALSVGDLTLLQLPHITQFDISVPNQDRSAAATNLLDATTVKNNQPLHIILNGENSYHS